MFAICVPALASDVVVITKAGADRALVDQLRHAASAYGLRDQVIPIAVPSDGANVVHVLKHSTEYAVVITTDALGDLNRRDMFDALRKPDGSRTPLLIVATQVAYVSRALFEWTSGSVMACKPPADNAYEWKMMFAPRVDILHQLAGIASRSSVGPICGLVLAHDLPSRVLASMQSGSERLPTFVASSISKQPVYVVSAMNQNSKIEQAGSASLQEAFSSIAGFVIFVREAAGERAWHTAAQYANLTVDDPWLTEPYGNLEYAGLLREMEGHNFHTTIGFVPWNWNRSQPGVVALFRIHPDRFSIAIHGNNHNHQEFGAKDTQSFNIQRDNIVQALARMEAFRKLSGLSYDRVMIFPHAIGPEETLEMLKRCNYWATVNSENVPMGSRAPNDPLFPLAPWTLEFRSFPSLRRISAEVPVSNVDISINAFLGNPQLFYVHQAFFERGIGAFDDTADEINRLEPLVQWRSLGHIIQHLYMTRLRSDHDYDVLTQSPNITLENPTRRPVVFHIRKPEDLRVPPRSIVVNGVPTPYQFVSNEVRLDVVVGPQDSSHIAISYSDDTTVNTADISNTSLLFTVDRVLSDFRDITLSRSRLGRKLRTGYYRYRIDKVEKLVERWGLVCCGLLLVYQALRITVAHWKRHSSI